MKLVELAKVGCRGDGSEAKRLVGEGIDVNGTGVNKMTPLISPAVPQFSRALRARH